MVPLARQLRERSSRAGFDADGLFASVLEAGCLVAAADGTVDETERRTIESAVASLADGTQLAVDVAGLVASSLAARDRDGLDARCAAVGAALRDARAAEEGLFLAAAIAYVSAGLAESELSVMERIAVASGISTAQLAVIATSVRDEIARVSIF